MKTKLYIALLVVLLGTLVHAQTDKGRSSKRVGPQSRDAGTIDIDERNSDAGGSGVGKDLGSGTGWDDTKEDAEEEEEEEEEEEVIDEEDEEEKEEEGSAAVMPPLHAVPPVKLPRCLKMRSDANSRQLIGAFRPQCTESGEFLPMQCHSSTGECWCVDKNGDEVVGTMRQAPDQPSCTGRGGDGGVVQPSWDMTTRLPPQRHRTTTQYATDDIVFGEASKGPGRNLSPAPYDPNTDGETDVDKGDGISIPVKDKTFFDRIRDPLILAGIIGGAVLALLCIVLIVMFTIYRMRKKDEGSYALEEPRRNYDIRYTRTKDQEFFA